MPNKTRSFERETHKKNLRFLSLTLPICLALWLTLSAFGVAMNPLDFKDLPQNMREAHLVNLFFQQDSWHFPFSLASNIAEGIPLSLTNNIPLMALIYKIIGSSDQYFGMWLILSFCLTAFFAHRICRNVSSHYLIACLGSILFLNIPFLWYHAFHNYTLAGQWVILWAYSLFFRKKYYFSPEWFGMIAVACLIHPFFALVCSFIMISNIVHLYVFNHSISVVKAATYFGNSLTLSIFIFSITGLFYLHSFASPYSISPAISFTNHISPYNPSYLNIGWSILIGVSLSLISTFTISKIKKYIKYFKPLIGSSISFLLLGFLGGVFINHSLFQLPKIPWLTNLIFPVFTSGPKFLFPILWLLPIILIHTIQRLEKRKKYLGISSLACILLIQLLTPHNSKPSSFPSMQELPQTISEFLEDRDEIMWVYQYNIPSQPLFFEQFGYYAFLNNKSINSAPVIRFPVNYTKAISQHSTDFFNKDFNTNSVYILSHQEFPSEFNELGTSIKFKNLILFKTSNSL